MSKILDDAYKALNWMGTNMRPVKINDRETGYKMELAVKAALDELKARENNEKESRTESHRGICYTDSA
jgi:hypothetical protein